MPEPLRKKGNIILTSQERAREKYLEQKLFTTQRIKSIDLKEYVNLKLLDLSKRIEILKRAYTQVKEHKRDHILKLIDALEMRYNVLKDEYTYFKKSASNIDKFNSLYDYEELDIRGLQRYAKKYYLLGERRKLKEILEQVIFIARTGLMLQDLKFDHITMKDLSIQSYRSIIAINKLSELADNFIKSGKNEFAVLCIEGIRDALKQNPLLKNKVIQKEWLGKVNGFYLEYPLETQSP